MMRSDVSNAGGFRVDMGGFEVQVSGTTPMKKLVGSFLQVKKLLGNRKLDGFIKIIPAWDGYEMFSGEIADVRRRMGLGDGSKRSGLMWSKIFRREYFLWGNYKIAEIAREPLNGGQDDISRGEGELYILN